MAASARASHPPASIRPRTGRPRAGRPRGRSRVVPHRRSRRRVLVVGLVLAAFIGVLGYALLTNPGSETAASGRAHGGGQGRHHHAQQSTPAAQASRHRPSPVATVAGRHAGPITGVAVQATGACTPGALCPVKVTVHFRPAATTQPVTWRVGTARTCTRGITWSPPVTVMAQPGWTNVYASSSVRVPKGRSSALTAVTTSPARAQSPPAPVAGSSLRC